ncbi:hypothetical protein TCAL_02196 [Tigriopus californicus]|uniref:Carboxylesterase type B domain-containing protein n=1 Tax=Tigriopus californicus TaxID=6832 RepID=A0A553P5Z9_TIGCA|nr:cholinesterase-like [Tigriopus californicus]TRY73092.1 hypothetical protein TCAL_02196 [Tigriopus californicus]|eukprot:TCALIF_02196-PA protein Name:"Similar to Ace Acetylcholinesterase (Anopheles gambiae)" AED:0.04 eAED:0.04 QI:89/1/1/1/0.90/0.91/12/65/718
MHLYRSISFLLTSLCVTNAFDDAPLLTVPTLGTLQGRVYQTVGNLQNTPKDYYSYKNIPYAHSVANEKRFTQPILREEQLGTPEDPFNARSSGPLCHQSSLAVEQLNTLSNSTMRDVIGQTLGSLTDAWIDAVVRVISSFVEFEIDPDMTVGEVLDEWLDIQLVVSEDCLHLSVNTPYSPKELESSPKKLPVMFFVHGGAFYMGTQMKMDASRLGDVADVIVVAINYRVGPLGFMCLNTEEAAGNMGMLDMVTALEWVQNNIQHFGGDPNQVTIFGESAGSASIGHLLLSPLTNQADLFSKGIGQSGSAISPWAFDREPNFHAKNIAAKLNCKSQNHTEIVECLRTRNATDITMKHMEYVEEQRAMGSLGFGGTIPCAQTKGEKKFYVEGQHPENILISGNYTKVPIMFGANKHEGSYVYGVVYFDFLVPNNIQNDTEFMRDELVLTLLRAVGISQEYALAQLLEQYFFQEWQMGDLGQMTPGTVDMLSTFFLKASSYKMVQENSKYENSYWYSIEHEASKKSVYNLLFSSDKPAHIDNPGVCHADELMYLFNVNLPLLLCNTADVFGAIAEKLQSCGIENIFECISDLIDPLGPFKAEWGQCFTGKLTQEEEVWSDRIVKMWTNFAKTGNPTPDDVVMDIPKIPAWSWDNPSYIALTKDKGVIKQDYTLTYNDVMSESLTPPPETTPTTSLPEPSSASNIAINIAALLALPFLFILL